MAVREGAVHSPLPLAGVPVQLEESWSHTGSALQVASAAHAVPDSQDHPGGCCLQLWGGNARGMAAPRWVCSGGSALPAHRTQLFEKPWGRL